MATKLRKDWTPILERAAEIVDEYDTGVTLRQVHYRLVAEAETTGSGYRNTENDYKHLSRRSAELRRLGEFPPLLDSTRGIVRPSTWESPADALQSLAAQYRRDLLAGQGVLPIVVVEKATLIAQVVSWFDHLCIPAVALRGYASESLERDLLVLEAEDEREAVLLYCGDFDPTGEDIPRAFEENTGLDLRRVALSVEQVAEYGLPPAMGKATDSRAAAFELRHGQLVQVELEALDPDDLRALLTAEIEELVDSDLSGAEYARERAEADRLVRLAENWQDD